MSEGWRGWDAYAPFYDWENARTVGRRDVAFWRTLAADVRGPVLELGCGTGRVTRPLIEAGVDLVGIDRSAPMLARARDGLRGVNRASGSRGRSAKAGASRPTKLIRGDIRALPFKPGAFDMVVAPYGVLQSLTRARDVLDTLADVARVLRRGGVFGIDLVPDVPNWREYENRVQLRGRLGADHLTLVESVRQDRAKRLTVFEQRYMVRRNGKTTEHRFHLTFRTVSVPHMVRHLEKAGFAIDAVLGDYRGRAWDERADVWIILAKKV